MVRYVEQEVKFMRFMCLGLENKKNKPEYLKNKQKTVCSQDGKGLTEDSFLRLHLPFFLFCTCCPVWSLLPLMA